MSNLTIRNFFISCGVLLLVGGCFGYAVYEVHQKEQTLRGQLTELAVRSQREASFNKLQKIATESAGDREILKNYFLPQSSDSITFLNQVEALAPLQGITLKTDSLDESSDKKTKQKWIKAEFTFSGTEEDVEEFVKILENVPYLSQITSLNLSARSSDNWEAKLSMKVFIAKS